MTPPPPDIEPIDAAPAPAWQPLTLRDWPLVLIGCAGIAAWLTHIIAAIGQGQWAFLVVGAVAAPIGVIHGLLIWGGVM